MASATQGFRPPRLVSKSVFDVAGARLAIGAFDRPLLPDECRRLRRAWEGTGLPGVEDMEVSPKQISFLTRPRRVDATWHSIDSILATSSRGATS